MKTIGLLVLALVAQSCFYHPYYKDNDREWWYFEDWDTNQDSILDKNEFTAGFEKFKMIKKVGQSESITNSAFDSLVVKMSSRDGEHPEAKVKAASLDIDGDQKLSEPELAVAMFSVADENADNKVSGLEFYVWEVYL